MPQPKFSIRRGNIVFLDYTPFTETRIRMQVDYCNESEWDKSTQRSKKNSKLNKYLNFIYDLCLDIRRDMSMDGVSSKSEFVKRLNTSLGNDYSQSFVSYIENFSKSKNYPDSVKGVLKHIIEDRPINSLDRQWFESYKENIISSGLSNSTAKTYHRIMIAACNQAYLDGDLITDPRKFKVKFARHLNLNVRHTPDELDNLYNYPFNGYMDFARDQYLIGCYTGARFNVYSELDERYLQDGQLVYQPKKNANYVVRIEPSDKLLTLINRIAEKRIKRGGYDKFLTTLPKLCETVGMIQPVMMRKNGVQVEFRKCDLVKTHTAKRTFACIAHDNGMPLIQIMKYLCHSSIQTTQRYLEASI